MECKEEYVRKITAKYNKRHATAFVRNASEKRFLGPWGLDLKKHAPARFGNQCNRLNRQEEFNLFAASHFMKYRLKTCSKRQADRYLGIYIALRNRVISSSLPLVPTCAKRHSEKFCSNDMPRLLENGYLALVSAADGFDPWRGYRFSTYACHAIIKSFYHRPKETKLKAEQLDERIDVAEPCPDENLALWIERLKKTLECTSLTSREAEVLAYRFGCFGRNKPKLTLKEVGDLWGLTRERIRQIQHIALGKLRDELCDDPILNIESVQDGRQ